MTKKLIPMFCIAGVLLLLLCGCSENSPESTPVNEKYAISREGEACYLTPSFSVIYSENAEDSSVAALQTPSFSSIGEMKEKILSGDIPEEELQNMLRVLGYSDGDEPIRICDPEKLYDVALPEGVSCDKVYWQGREYGFSLTFDNSIRGYVDVISKSNLDHKCSWILSGQDHIFSDETVEDRNARVIHYKNTSGEFKKILYTFPADCGDILVEEVYAIKDYFEGSSTPVSSQVPYYVSLYGTHDDAYFFGWFTGMTERPSEEWLRSFDLKEFGWQADGKNTATLPELVRTYPDRLDGTDLSFSASVNIKICYPDRCVLVEEGSDRDTAAENATNTTLDFVTYSDSAEYEILLAKRLLPNLTYHDDLYFGNEYGPYGAYINWYDYLHQLPNVRAALTEDMKAAYEDENGNLYHLPIPGIENGSWTVANIYDNTEDVLRFVDWIYSEEGMAIFFAAE